MAAQEIKVPDIGDFDAVEVIEVLVAEGDTVEEEQALITLESDKATLEVPTTVAGKITEIKVKEGDSVGEGDVIALLEADDDSDAGDEGDDDETGAGEDDDAQDSGGDQHADDKSESDEADEDGAEKTDDEPNKAERKTSSDGGTQEIKVPDIGDFDEVEVIEVLVAAGDTVEKEQPLITLESDKATLEVPSTVAGTIAEMKVKEGDTVGEGDVIATVETEGGDEDPGEKQTKSSGSVQKDTDKDADQSADEAEERESSSRDDKKRGKGKTPQSGSGLTPVDEKAFAKAHASPSVRKYARELGVDLGKIKGSGRHERILAEDVNEYVKGAVKQAEGSGAAAGGGGVPAQPDIDYSQFGEIEEVELSRIRKLSAKAVHRNWLLIPHVTQFDTADITEMEAFRQANKDRAAQQDIKLTPLAFMLKASAAALKAFPDMNSSLSADGESLIRKHYIHIAVAVDTEGGLMMPVLRDVDKKGIFELAGELGEISGRARDGKLKANEMKGASFSISSLGGVGGTAFTPIVNSPEVAILGVSKAETKPVWQDGEFVPRLILPLSLSYDHRVIDGAKAARITGFLSRALSDLRTLLL